MERSMTNTTASAITNENARVVETLRTQLEQGERQLAELALRLDEAMTDHDTLQEDRDGLARLTEAARADVQKTRRALERVEAGTYGLCRTCGGTIAPERLEAIPTVERCATCA
jgi:DnaK suppressor protein